MIRIGLGDVDLSRDEDTEFWEAALQHLPHPIIHTPRP